MEESWIPYLNVIIAVHDVTAFGNTQVWHPSLVKFPFYCIYLYQILINIRSWRNRFLLSLNSFSVMKTTYDLTTYRTIIHTIIRHQRSHCLKCPITILKFTWIRWNYYIRTSANESENGQDYPHRTYGTVFIAAHSARNDKTKLPSSQGHQTDHNSHLLGGRKIGLLRLTYHTHTRIYLEEIGLLFVTSKAPST